MVDRVAHGVCEGRPEASPRVGVETDAVRLDMDLQFLVESKRESGGLVWQIDEA